MAGEERNERGKRRGVQPDPPPLWRRWTLVWRLSVGLTLTLLALTLVSVIVMQASVNKVRRRAKGKVA
jgi:hypothetical protein